MPSLSVVKNYADGTILNQTQLNLAFSSIEDFVNSTKLDSSNIQDSGVEADNLATNAVTTDKLAVSAVTLEKLATEVINRLMPVGTIISSGAITTPEGYLYCDGSQVSRTTYSALFTAIGESFGQGNNTTTFHLPDLRGRFLRGQNDGSGQDPDASSRTASATGGNTGDAIGSQQSDEFDSHNHGSHTHGVNDSGHNHNFVGVDPPDGFGGIRRPVVALSTLNFFTLTSGANNAVQGSTTGISIASTTPDSNGGNETRPKNINIRYYIKT